MKNVQPEANDPSTVPDPVIRKKKGISLVWLIPLVTFVIGGWLIFKTVSEQGPKIDITFKTAEGIEAGKTKIKFKEIDIGMVDSLRFSEDFSHVILSVSMDRGTESFLRRGTRFWVVKPRLSLRGASGLGTLLSGAYIEIEPGLGLRQKYFTGLDKPPVVKADVPGSKIMLLTNNLGSIDTGSPVYYQGILAGEILGWELGSDKKSIFIHAFIKAPYHKLVNSNTKFWDISGVDFSFGAEGVALRTESIQSLLYGGVAFETPDSLADSKEDIKGLVFTLYDDYKSIAEQSYTRKVTFVLFFEGSVRGLAIGAPVEFKGIKIGSVTDIRLEFHPSDSSFRIPVLVELEPERILLREDGQMASPIKTLNTLIQRGLRARLKTGSLVTGQLFVDLDMHPETQIKLVNEETPYPELPTIPADIEQMTASVKKILNKIESLDLDEIAAQLHETLKGTGRLARDADRLINKKELHEAIATANNSLLVFKGILKKVDSRVTPITDNIDKAVAAGNDALEKAQTTMNLINDVLNPDSPLHFRFIELSGELAETARSIRTLVDMLERNPNAIFFGKEPAGENE